QGRRRKTTRIRDQACLLDRFTIRFSQAVNKFRLRTHRRMRLFVMLLKNTLIAKSKVSREINRFQISGQAWNNVHRLPVREREENTVEAIELFRSLNESELRQSIQVAMHFADRFTRLLVRRHKYQFDVRMK